MKASKEQFCAIPICAISDTRLTLGDLRLLKAIAFYDRFGRNAQGCYAKRPTLAKRAALHPKNVPRHVKRLLGFGYICRKRNPSDRRRWIYRVIYDETPVVIEKGARPEPLGNGQVVLCDDKTAEKAVKTEDVSKDAIHPKCQQNNAKLELRPNRRDPAKQSRKEGMLPSSNVDIGRRSAKYQKPPLARQWGKDDRVVSSQQVHQITSLANQSKREAETRLGNAIVGLPDLWDQLDPKLWPGYMDAYERAVDVEHESPGKGIKYFIGAARRANKQRRDRKRGNQKK